MAEIDTGGSGQLGILRGIATAVASSYAVAPVGPADRSRHPARTVPLSLLVSSTSDLGTDVQVQVATGPSFAQLVWANTLLDLDDGVRVATVAGLTNLTTYYWRARAAEAGTTGWGPWSPTWSVRVDLEAGKARHYVEQNVGPVIPPGFPAVQYVDLNQGPIPPRPGPAIGYAFLNGGFRLVHTGRGSHYVDLGDVSTAVPVPLIWFLLPTRGAAGDGIRVYGWGFGDLPSSYNGRLEYRDPVSGAWEPLPVTSWRTVVAGPDAYTAARKISELDGIITTQHTVLEFTIPATALPPGFPVRVVTEGA